MRKIPNEELGRLSVEEFKSATKLPVIIVLDNIRSMNNIGSVFRTADAFRVQAVYLCGLTATPPHRDIQKTALGATESVDWKYFNTTVEAVKDLKKDGFTILAVEQIEGSKMLDEIEVAEAEKFALVFGSEVGGVEEAVVKDADGAIEIPQIGTKHSLNIAVSVGVVIWEFFKKNDIK